VNVVKQAGERAFKSVGLGDSVHVELVTSKTRPRKRKKRK